ncbi:hypothetical protein TrVGV298_000819 [Trichoderma virens]|nr:hypothetical protein TrVGV298_000819 [Trichoderma virens]
MDLAALPVNKLLGRSPRDLAAGQSFFSKILFAEGSGWVRVEWLCLIIGQRNSYRSTTSQQWRWTILNSKTMSRNYDIPSESATTTYGVIRVHAAHYLQTCIAVLCVNQDESSPPVTTKFAKRHAQQSSSFQVLKAGSSDSSTGAAEDCVGRRLRSGDGLQALCVGGLEGARCDLAPRPKRPKRLAPMNAQHAAVMAG